MPRPVHGPQRSAAESIDLEVSVIDESLSEVSVGSTKLIQNAVGHWLAPGLALTNEGDDHFTVQALDLYGNRSELELTIERDTTASTGM